MSDAQAIVELYKQGSSISQVAESLQCSESRVRRALENSGVPRRTRSSLNRLGIQPRVVSSKGAERNEPPGNCVRCRHCIPFGREFTRIPGVLGKVCLDCA